MISAIPAVCLPRKNSQELVDLSIYAGIDPALVTNLANSLAVVSAFTDRLSDIKYNNAKLPDPEETVWFEEVPVVDQPGVRYFRITLHVVATWSSPDNIRSGWTFYVRQCDCNCGGIVTMYMDFLDKPLSPERFTTRLMQLNTLVSGWAEELQSKMIRVFAKKDRLPDHL